MQKNFVENPMPQRVNGNQMMPRPSLFKWLIPYPTLLELQMIDTMEELQWGEYIISGTPKREAFLFPL